MLMHNEWTQNSGKLVKTFKFKDFKEALKFINTVGQIAESMNHHPNIMEISKVFQVCAVYAV